MKVLRYRIEGVEGVGILENDYIIPLHEFCAVNNIEENVKSLIEDWDNLEELIIEHIDLKIGAFPLDQNILLAPIPSPEKFLAIGMNYKKHRAESIDAGITPPRNQMWFTKQVSCINDPNGDIIKPESTMMLDYEVELALVIGKTCYQVSAKEASDYIFGYMICNDISMRDWQLHNMPDRVELMIGKSHDTHGPIGPWIVTSEEIADPHNLKINCYVNNELRQSSDTGDMIWNCFEQIEYLSSAMTLKPGDIITTGTPPGSGFSPRGASGKADKERKGNVFLEPGDIIKCEIESIGAIINKIIIG